MPNKFMHDYLVFDEFGIQKILCMACAKPIKTRSEIVSNTNPNLVIRELSRHADYREIPIILESGNIAFIMVCDDCKFTPIYELEAKAISEQLRNALRMQLKQEGKLSELIEEILKKQQFNVVRKAEVAEVTATLSGSLK